MFRVVSVMAVMSVYSVAKVDSVVDWVTNNLYQKSQLFSDCLECVSQLPLQKEHKLNLRRCLSGFSKEMTVEEKGIAIQFLLRIISSKQEYSLCDLLCSLLFSLSYEQYIPILPTLARIMEAKKCVSLWMR